MFSSDTKRSAYQRVYEDVRSKILSGELRPGDRLAAEHQMSAQHSVGRSTVREVIRSLASENLVTTRRGVSGGTFVTTPSRDHLSGTLTTGIDLLTATSELTIDELIEARELLEVPGASLAARRRTEDQLRGLDMALDRTSAVDGDPGFESNYEFHRSVLEISGNRFLEMMTRPVFAVLHKRLGRRSASTDFWDRVHADHSAIAEAIRAGDEGCSGRLMAEHLQSLRAGYQWMANQ